MIKRIGLLALTLGLISWASAYYVLAGAPIAQAMGVRIAGLTGDALKRTRVLVIGHPSDKAVHPIEGTGYWRFDDPVWIGSVLIQVSNKDLAQIEAVEISLGMDEPVVFGRSEILQWFVEEAATRLPREKCAPGDVVVWVPDRFGRASSLPWVASRLAIKTPRGTTTSIPWNWPGDASCVRAILHYALLPCVLAVFWVGRWTGRSAISGPVTNRSPPGQEKFLSYDWIAPLFLIGMLTMLEWRDPYYFTQDDNLVESLPMILVGCRGIWLGEFPDYNPYIYMGSPLASLGMYGLTYPPLLLSYAFARHVLGDEFATIDVFVILHLLVGFFVIRRLGRKLGMGSLAANLTGLSCVLSGAALIMGRCWFNFTPVFVWMPVLLLGVVELRRGSVSWKWVVGVGLAAGMAFHVGFSQAAIYVNGFFCLAVGYLVATGAIPWRRAMMVVPALLIGAGLALPLVYQQWIFTRDLSRHSSAGTGIAVGLPAILLPYPLVRTTMPVPIGSDNLQQQGQFYFFGGLFAFLFLYQLVGWLFVRPGRGEWPDHVWTFLALIVIWLALGDAGGLWQIVTELPVIGSINRHPLRLMPFVVMFVSLSAGLSIRNSWGRLPTCLANGRLATCPTNWQSAIRNSVGVAALLVLALHVTQCRTAFYTYRFRPYPELPEELRVLFRQHESARVSSWANQRSTDADFAWFLPQDLPAVYELGTADGYCPLLGGKPQVLNMIRKLRENPLAAMKAYGIRWHVTYAGKRPTPHTPVASSSWTLEVMNKSAQFHKPPSPEEFPHPGTVSGILVTQLADASPLAFATDNPQQGLKLAMGSGGVDVDVSGLEKSRRVVVNFLHYPNIQAYVDDVPLACAPDSWYRIQVQVPAGHSKLSIHYEPPWMMGLWLGLGTAAAGVVLLGLQLRHQETASKPQ